MYTWFTSLSCSFLTNDAKMDAVMAMAQAMLQVAARDPLPC